MEDAEMVAIAMRAGPDIAEFVEEYLRLGPCTNYDIAAAWAEQACDAVPEASDIVYQDVISNCLPQLPYYTGSDDIRKRR